MKCNICNFESDNPDKFTKHGQATYCNDCWKTYSGLADEYNRIHELDRIIRARRVIT